MAFELQKAHSAPTPTVFPRLPSDPPLVDALGETVQLSYRPVGNSGYEHFTALACTSSSARLLKAVVRNKCDGLVDVPDARIRLLFRGVELPDDAPLAKHVPAAAAASMGLVELQFLVLQGEADDVWGSCGAGLERVEEVPCPEEFEAALVRCAEALHDGVEPIMANGGTGGVYFLRDSDAGRPLAVFKPKDEEAGSPLNPHGYEGPENSRGLKPGVPSAHRAAREVAAYLLDRAYGGFSSVPMTTLARGKHRRFAPLNGGDVVWKIGAAQAFVDTTETSDNFGPQSYSVGDVHRVGILDVRIANSDRNYGNLLVHVGGERATPSSPYSLVPIDHGCSLPDRLAISRDDAVWMAWPQARMPFDEEELAVIASLDGAKDACNLEAQLGLERHGLRLLEVTTLWLQFAAKRRCTLRDVGEALYRINAEAGPSEVEKVIDRCVDSAFTVQLSCRAPPAEGGGGLFRTSTHTPSTVSRICRRPEDGIFVRRDVSGNELPWTSHAETDFRRHVLAGLERLALTTEPRPVDPEPPRRVSRAYVPPHLRNKG